jgi:hypothetical protein
LRQATNIFSKKSSVLSAIATILVIAGCSLEKKSGFNRAMQNLTAKYNILFNANELLRIKQDSYEATYIDDYTELLPVFRDTVPVTENLDKDLEEVKVKANKIIGIKEQSHYIGDAYLLLSKANYLERNFFDAVEYANYVVRSFGNDPELKQEALVWKARSLMYLRQPADAKVILDTAVANINLKKDITGDVYGAKLQYDINTQEYADGEQTAKLAIEYARTKMQRMRLTFILGQLQELNQKPTEAIESYNRVAASNVAFEMAFNAKLNRIRIEDSQNGVKISRVARLRSLLKEQNNQDFIDQIYYQVGLLQYNDHEVEDAITSYKLSAAKSTKNQNQKGLSYLRLADIYFKDKADYTQAKMYYDSTLLNLSTNYPGYVTIQRKADNLQLLTDQLQIIAHEDTLQMLARLNDTARASYIDEMVNNQVLQQQTLATPASPAQVIADRANPQLSVPNGTAFYFYNSKAVSQGYNDFKRVWGNRKLEDNWRRSNKTNADIAAAVDAPKNVDPDAPAVNIANDPNHVDAANYRQGIVQNLPLTPELMAQSNKRIFDAYLEIANFYRDVLGDKKEAITAYELLLTRFPDNDNKPAIYYNLYRLYAEANTAQSDKYKNLLLQQYPQTPFAKSMADPDFARRMNDDDNEFTTLYNKVYDLYVNKQYSQVITSVDGLMGQYPDNRLAAQLLYLRAFAAGHEERLVPFSTDLQTIVTKYPQDALITPLVNQHLAYIAANQAELAARPVIITDNDLLPFSIPIVYQQKTEYRPPSAGPYEVQPDIRKPEPKNPEPAKVAEKPAVQQPAKPEQPPAETPPLQAPVQANQPTVTTPAKTEVKVSRPVPTIFNLRDSTNYYFVVAVNSGTTNLASSRFGIGQFNRVNFEGGQISHQLKNAGADNQLIYVGRFTSLTNVKDYAKAIIPLLPDIMKVPKDKYSFFIITRENLDKLADQKTLDSYKDYDEKTY